MSSWNYVKLCKTCHKNEKHYAKNSKKCIKCILIAKSLRKSPVGFGCHGVHVKKFLAHVKKVNEDE